MFFLCEQVMPKCLYLLRLSVALIPRADPNFGGFTKRQAVVVGHMVRLTKLYDAFYRHVAARELEIAGIMARLIFDTEIRFDYLIRKATPKSYKTYILGSYRAERENLLDLAGKAQKRRLIPIERRMRASIRRALRDDGISLKNLMANKVWDIDGKNVRALLEALGRGWEYSYSFGNASRWIHGGWLELKQYHLQRDGSRYRPRLDWGDPDTRLAGPISWRLLNTMLDYLKWAKSDPDGSVATSVEMVADIIRRLDEEHERRLSD